MRGGGGSTVAPTLHNNFPQYDLTSETAKGADSRCDRPQRDVDLKSCVAPAFGFHGVVAPLSTFVSDNAKNFPSRTYI